MIVKTQQEIEYLNWIAGFYEGEGSCGFYKYERRGTYRLVVGITQKESEVLDKIREAFGFGSVSKIRKDRVGEVHVLHISGYAAEDFLKSIRPYIRSTRKCIQMEKALEGWNGRPIKKNSKNAEKIKAANK